MPSKNEEIEQPIPIEWRSVIVEIVEDIRNRDLRSKEAHDFEVKIDKTEALHVYQTIDYYGYSLSSLPEEAWHTATCRWMGIYWQILVDLFTEDEGLSDLVLFLNAYEKNDSLVFEICSVHVP